MQKLVSLLGGWPPHFDQAERDHGEALLRYLNRDRLIDEPVFGQVVRYAVHRAAFDRLSVLIVDQTEGADPDDDSYLSGSEQKRAYHENKLAALEQQLIATPYARMKSGASAQTSFMDALDAQAGQANNDKAKVVHPFRPISKKARS